MLSFFKSGPKSDEPENPNRREFLNTSVQGGVAVALLLTGLAEAEAETFKLPDMEDNRLVDNKSIFRSARELEAAYKQKLYERTGGFEYYEPHQKGLNSKYFKERVNHGATMVDGVPIFPQKGEEVRKIPRDMAILGQIQGGPGYAVVKSGTRVITVEGGTKVTHIADCANPVSVGGLVKCEVIQQTQGK